MTLTAQDPVLATFGAAATPGAVPGVRYNAAGPGRRMKRRLLNLLTALSLLPCVAVVGLWARSYWRHDQGLARRGRQVLIVYSVSGRLAVTWGTERDSR